MENFKNRLILSFFAFAILLIFSENKVLAQCNSSVKAETKSISEDRGEIIVKIISSESYICKLNTVSGKGIEAIDTQNGNGNKTITFSNQDKSKIYQVDVEFLTEEKDLCKRLQKNDLIFESN